MGMNPRTLRPSATGFNPRSISGLALWLDAADTSTLYTTDAGPVTAVSSPLDISGCKLWLDADDASTFTLVGSSVSEWRDKSGSGAPHATQSSAPARPSRVSAAVNGRAAVEFQGTHALTFASSTASFNYLHNATGATVFIVVRPDTASNPDAIRYLFNNTNNSSANVGVSIFIDDRSSVSRNNGLFATASRGVSGAATSSVYDNNLFAAMDAYSVVAITFDNANATAAARLLLRANGGQAAAVNTTSNAASSGNASLDMTVGNFGGGGSPAGIAEIVFYEGVLSTTSRARVEAYLAAKWGISGVHAPATTASSPVGYWADKSGNARHATQATAASRPTVAAVNGRAAASMNGTSSRLALPAMDSTPSTVLAVVRHNSGTASATRSPLCIADGASYMVWQVQQTGTVRVGAGYNASRLNYSASGIDPQGQTILLAGQMSSGGGGLIGRFNAADLPGTDTVGFADGGLSRLGCRYRNADDQFWSGEICEVLHYQSALSLAQVQRLERYLAAKWGITLAPQVSNADAQDWINRVYANGGTVSASTAAAVNTFCNAIDAASIRDRFYRLSLFCGGVSGTASGLAACLVPLYRGPSLGGTQYGGTTDTNNGPFVSGDYAETGASGGLTGNGSSKYLDTLFPMNTLPSTTSGHAAVYCRNRSSSTAFHGMVGVGLASATGFGVATDTTLYSVWANFAFAANTTNGLLVASRTSATSNVAYANTTTVATNANSVTPTATATNAAVFASRSLVGSLSFYDPRSYQMYSIGTGLSAADVTALSSAVNAFQTALGRA
jgi:hypothetical protein